MRYEEGRYQCEVMGHGIGETKNAKLPHIWISFIPVFRLTGDGEREVIEAPDKRSYTRLLTNRDGEVTEKMEQFLKADLEAVGFQGELVDLVRDSENFWDCTGNGFVAKCSFTTRDGNEYEDWQIEWKRAGGTALNDTTVAQLNALYGGLKGSKESGKAEVTSEEALKVTAERF